MWSMYQRHLFTNVCSLCAEDLDDAPGLTGIEEYKLNICGEDVQFGPHIYCC